MAEAPKTQKARFVTDATDAGRRLDQILAARVPGLSRRQARAVVDIGGVFVDKARVKIAGRVLREGQTIEITWGGALARSKEDRPLPEFSIVHEDRHLLVVDKPAGLHTVPTPESDRGNLIWAIEQQRGAKVHVVHRIDLMTSGLLVVALTEDANRELSEIFRVHDVERAYLAAVLGAWPEDAVRCDEPIDGRHAITHFDVVERHADVATLLRARLETGRTHQIRLHCRALGHPVLGDRKHGHRTGIDPPRMALHATVLGFRHPFTMSKMRFESPLPADLASWWSGLVQRAP